MRTTLIVMRELQLCLEYQTPVFVSRQNTYISRLHSSGSHHISVRTLYVRTIVTTSKPSAVLFGVPQGSVLGPIVFVLYTADILQLVRNYGLLPHAYADDTQILGVRRPSATDELQLRVSDLIAWMLCYRGWQLIVYS